MALPPFWRDNENFQGLGNFSLGPGKCAELGHKLALYSLALISSPTVQFGALITVVGQHCIRAAIIDRCRLSARFLGGSRRLYKGGPLARISQSAAQSILIGRQR